MPIDVLLVLLLAGGFVLGFVRGVVRQVLTLGGWLVCFVAAAYLRVPLGQSLAGASPQFGTDYATMLGFAVIFLAAFSGVVLIAQFTGSGSSLTRHEVLDDTLGGIVGLALAALFIGSVLVVLDTYFAHVPLAGAGEFAWLRELDRSLDASAAGSLVREWLIRGVGFVLAPLLPADVRAVMV